MAQRVFTQTFGVVAAIIEKEGKILLVKESGLKGWDKGKWNHPAGWIEVGENPIEGIKREVFEETGFNFVPRYLLGLYSLVRKDKETIKARGGVVHPVKIVFLGEISSGQKSLAEDVVEIKWFAPEEIYGMDAKTLRDFDIKQMVRDYFAGKRYPLNLLTHTVVE
jgi:ADP-ribose pyrophosphatase YjhB (NUDIX family)